MSRMHTRAAPRRLVVGLLVIVCAGWAVAATRQSAPASTSGVARSDVSVGSEPSEPGLTLRAIGAPARVAMVTTRGWSLGTQALWVSCVGACALLAFWTWLTRRSPRTPELAAATLRHTVRGPPPAPST